MSGTSLDGNDLCAVRFSLHGGSWAYQVLAAHTYPYPDEWHDRLEGLAASSTTAFELAKAHVDYGHYLGLLLRRFCIEAGVTPQFVALHGHTVFHRPWQQVTWQVGCGETVASYLTVPVVANFRARDVALGGEGAPLVPLGEWHLFPDTGLFLNLGGVANVSIFRERLPSGDFDEKSWLRPGWHYLAYDLCGCNLILNTLAQRYDTRLAYDPEGSVAAAGELSADLLAQLEGIGFYHQVPPRSLGTELLAAEVWPVLDAHPAPLPDKLHTWCHHLAAHLAAELGHLGIGHTPLRVTGGGAHNRFLMACLREALAPLGVTVAENPPLLTDYKEALVFAFLGLRRLLGQPTVLPGATGARVAESTGSVHLPTGTALWAD